MSLMSSFVVIGRRVVWYWKAGWEKQDMKKDG